MAKKEIHDSASPPNVTITLDGDKADVSVGGHGRAANLTLRGSDGEPAIQMIAGESSAGGGPPSGVLSGFELLEENAPLVLDARGQTLWLAGGAIRLWGRQGALELWSERRPRQVRRVRLDAEGNLWLGGRGGDGDLLLFHRGETDSDDPSKAAVHLDADRPGLTLRTASGQRRVRLDGGGGSLWLGGQEADGDLLLFHRGATDNLDKERATIHLDGESSSIVMRDSQGNRQLRIDGSKGHLWLGGKENDGDILLFRKGEADPDDKANATIHIDGEAGDIVLRNADCAEDFELAPDCPVDAGTVVALDDEGRLRPSRAPYDRRVAGVISGAGDLRPGIVLGRRPDRSGVPLALAGRVNCRVDTSAGAIAAGDLLTTSEVPGHAMKAADPGRAFGSVIGKALRPLVTGTDLIPVLVALQ